VSFHATQLSGCHHNSSSHSQASSSSSSSPLSLSLTFDPSRISDLGKSLKKAAPVIQEKFQFGVEAQFAGMLFAVVALFYASWTTLVVSESCTDR